MTPPNWAEKEERERDMRCERRKKSVTPVYVECDQQPPKVIRTSAISCEFNGCFLYTCIYELIFDESRALTLMSKAFVLACEIITYICI
jgi:hypothetical protein